MIREPVQFGAERSMNITPEPGTGNQGIVIYEHFSLNVDVPVINRLHITNKPAQDTNAFETPFIMLKSLASNFNLVSN